MGVKVAVGLALCAALVCLSCGGEPDVPVEQKDAGTKSLDAGQSRRDAGERPDAKAGQRFGTASATLSPVLDAEADGGLSVTGTASWAGTVEGVDLEVSLVGCAGEQSFPLAILEGADCSPATLSGPEWAEGRGSGLPAMFCNGTGVGVGGLSYVRLSSRPAAWRIGGQTDAELVGHALVVRDARGTTLACGAIERGPDVERRALPPKGQPPKLETQAAVGGVCLARQFTGSNAKCPDNAALLRCQEVHCDVASCLDTCAEYASCLDQQDEACDILGPCQPSAACAACQSDAQQCGMYFCGEHMFCGVAPTPDGPCGRMAGCCALQGGETQTCLGLLLPFLAGLGGDADCQASMMDWDVVSHLHVPCTFGAGEPSMFEWPAPPTSDEAQLADEHAGVGCERDADCPGGGCARGVSTGAGYCTRACEATAECGAGGRCSGKRCLANCGEHADCRDGFLCTGKLEGARIALSGVCSPKRQADQLGDGLAGRACEDDSECSGGRCAHTDLLGADYPGSYCTARCYEDAQCGDGGVCLWTHHSSDPGYCLQRCTADADCTREDHGCWELGDGARSLHACYPLKRPLPDNAAGQPCTSDADCGAPHAFCAQELPYEGLITNELQPAPAGYCTQRCARDRECGAGAQCINYGSSGGLCFASCSSSAPCREGYACFGHSRDNDETASVCVAPGP